MSAYTLYQSTEGCLSCFVSQVLISPPSPPTPSRVWFLSVVWYCQSNLCSLLCCWTPLLPSISKFLASHTRNASVTWIPYFVSLLDNPWRRQWQPTPVFLPGKSHGWRSLISCSPWDCEESDMTERLPFHFSLSCIGEGNGSPLQCSCLENPRDGGAWWAAFYGVSQSWTRLKRLSSSSSS